MQTFLIISQNQPFIENKLTELKKKLNVSDLDTLNFYTDEKLGIENVREITGSSIVRPYSGENRLTIIRNFQNSTFEAQNSLLKFLEESPVFLTIILISPSTQNILPTVLSRTQIIIDDQKKDFQKIDIASILSLSLGQRLLFIQNNIKTKDEALTFLENLNFTLEDLLLKNGSANNFIDQKDIAVCIKKTDKALNYLQLNVNYKHVLDIFLIGFPTIKT